MNKIECKLMDILRKGREEFGLVATKAEFETEGARTDELLKLRDISAQSDIDLTLKIGGCAAIRDLWEAKQLGIKYIVAPMIESDYSLAKYIAATQTVYSTSERNYVQFLFNLETSLAIKNSEEIMNLAINSNSFAGVVFGRSDFSASLGLGIESIETESVNKPGLSIARSCKLNNLKFALGGSITEKSIANIMSFKSVHLTRLETRKIVFDSAYLTTINLRDAIKLALEFELLWLVNKSNHYSLLSKEDEERIRRLRALNS